MDPVRWRKIEALYQEAASRAAEERSAFLAEACGNDTALKRDVEDLLAASATGVALQTGGAFAFGMGPWIAGAEMAGRRIGVYEINQRIGVGGMGEVYRARDTRLGRDVAIKILPPGFGADTDRLVRFEREARVLAALNHSNIATIHGVQEDGGTLAIVMELVEGETLAERIGRGPLPVPEALRIAGQIAEALDAAHEKGIVHRDLKPANVKIRPDGTVKVLDFGLAKNVVGPAASVDLTQARTPAIAGTRKGTIVGTAAYMSPEQARGESVDKRTDIWAYGCVLYEMLAGRAVFARPTVTDTLAAVVDREPEWSALPGGTPPSVKHLLLRCLEKERKRRLRDIGDAHADLGGQPSRWTLSRMAATAGFVLTAVAGVGAVFALRQPETAPDVPTLRFEIPTAPADDPSTALSPDGTRIAFIASQDRVPTLWVRALDSIESRALPATAGASYPFWSPDGRTIGFFAGDKLRRVEIAGGMPLDVADAPNGRGGTWNADGVILFVRGVSAPIMRVPARGGTPQAVTQVNTGSGPAHRLPQFLPGGTRFLFTSTLGTDDTNGIYVGSLDGEPPVRIVAGDTGGRFAPPNYLLTIRQGALRAYPFDPEAAAVVGEPVVLAQGLGATASISVFATSDTGVLAYRPGTTQRRQLGWVNRAGALLGVIGEPRRDLFASPELSPDEQSVVMFEQSTGDNDIWVIELARNLRQRVTDGPPADAHPLWDPDGQHVVFNSQRFGRGGPARQALMGGQAAPLLADERGVVLSWTRDRQYVLVRRETAEGGADLVAVATGGAQLPEIAVAQSRSDETEGQFSPDGRWVVFVSNQSGRPEVFVQAFPSGQPRTQVSTSGGTQVRWSGDGREIFYVGPDGYMMAVAIALSGATPNVGLPAPLFRTYLATGPNVLGYKPQYAVSRDGRFLLNTAIEGTSPPIVVSVNWMKTLAR